MASEAEVLEAAAKSMWVASWPEVPWSEVDDDVKQDVIDSTAAAITRFLEEPMSKADFESCFSAYAADGRGDRQGVSAAIARYRRILLDRVKGGK